MNVTLTPYLTDYKTAKAAKEAYANGKDFILNAFGHRYDGKPCKKADMDKEGNTVMLRFSNGRKIANP